MKRVLPSILGAVLLLGCGPPGPDAEPSITQRDSAGVLIAETPGPIWEDAPRWTTSAEPVVGIGALEGEDAYLFSGIRGIVELADGRIVVSDNGSNSLRWYDSSGRFLFQRGGTGEGPGEFTRLGAIVRTPGDTLVITDGRLRRITVFSPDGALVETVPIEGLTVPGAAYRLADGSFILGSSGFSSTQMDGQEEGLHRASEPLLRLGGGLEAPDTLGMFPGPEMYFQNRDGRWSFGFHPYSRGFYYGVREGLVFVASAETFAVDAYSPEGELVRSIRAPMVDLRLTPEVIEAYKDGARQASAEQNEERRQATRDALDEMYFPEDRPAYSRLLVSDDALWLLEHGAGRAQAENRWAIFGQEGEFRGTAVLPAGFNLQDVRGDHVLGSWRDALDVEYARVYRLTPAGG